MSIDYLGEMEHEVDSGREIYACPGPQGNEWYISSDLEDLNKKAQRSASALKREVHIYKLINKMDTVSGDSYLVVRKILEPGPKGEPKMQWTLVDTREAAEMMRDVSQGPTPFFGTSTVSTFLPA
jgi:hypothetical protein